MGTLTGTWRLVAFEETLTGGECIHPYGEHPVGLLIYTDTGHMSVQIMHPNRRPLPELAPEEIGADLVKEAVAGFTGFCGTYQVDADDQVVIHHVQCHILPGSVGKDLKRKYELAGDRLVLRPSAGRVVTWERLK